jgi:tetratricopeptide (TPR) repeat protein
VQTGEKSTDEMGNMTFEVLPHDARGLTRLRLSNYERLLGGADTARNQYNLANALADDARADEAIAHYRRAVAEDPALAPAHFNLGNLLMARGSLEEAIEEFRAAVRAKPDFASADVNLGHALEANGDRKDAIAAFREAVAIDAKSSIAHASLGAALAKEGKRSEAADQFDEAFAIDPGDRRIRSALDELARDGGAPPR